MNPLIFVEDPDGLVYSVKDVRVQKEPVTSYDGAFVPAGAIVVVVSDPDPHDR